MTSQTNSLSSDHESRLVNLIRADAWIIDLLRDVRSLQLPEWCIAAGVIRNNVWDHLRNYSDRTEPSYIDVLFFDQERAAGSYQGDVEERLSALMPGVNWEAVKQAAVHRYHNDTPYESIEAAMLRWADQVTAVGAYFTDDDQIVIVAALGLQDLFDMVVTPNLLTSNADRDYRIRMRSKRWNERWPKLTVVWPGDLTRDRTA